MATQADRRQATRAAILAAASRLFGKKGFGETSMDAIAGAAGVAKGAVYHHFPTKEAVFEAVLEQTSADLARTLAETKGSERDALAAMAAGARGYFAACSKGLFSRIILRDGPAVLGWERWREIDTRHFGGSFPLLLQAAMDQGLVAPQPVEPLARLLLGAATEAAVACASQDDIAKAGRAYADAFAALVDSLRLRPRK